METGSLIMVAKFGLPLSVVGGDPIKYRSRNHPSPRSRPDSNLPNSLHDAAFLTFSSTGATVKLPCEQRPSHSILRDRGSHVNLIFSTPSIASTDRGYPRSIIGMFPSFVDN